MADRCARCGVETEDWMMVSFSSPVINYQLDDEVKVTAQHRPCCQDCGRRFLIAVDAMFEKASGRARPTGR